MDTAPARSDRLLGTIARNPSLATEVMTLHALAAVGPRLRTLPARSDGRGAPAPEALQHAVARAARRAGTDGAVTGTSFVVGYPAAMGSLFLTQLLMVLQIAAAHGHDPTDAMRAAELLVIRGRHATTEEALRSLAVARRLDTASPPAASDRRDGPSWRHPLRWLRARWSRVRQTAPLDLVIGVMGIASFVIPLIGIPVCAYGAARATRRLGLRAIDYYSSGAPAPGTGRAVPLPPALSPRAVILAAVGIVASIAVGLTLSVLWVGQGHHGLWRIALAGVWACVLLAYARLGLLLGWRRPSAIVTADPPGA